jgi:RHS repeat-associated protein
MVDPTGTTSYAYDALDRLSNIQFPTSNIQYAYDAVGNRTRITYPNSNVVTYTYDAANRLTNVTDWASRAFAYIYDAASNRTRLNYPNGAYTTYAYDALNRLTALTTTGASGTLFSASYTLDNVGNRTRMVDSEGTTNYTYDALYRLSNFQSPTSNLQYTYDAMGNRATMVNSVSGTTNYTYDAADRLLTAGATAFTWDNNGNQLTKGAATYAYDVANRLTQVVNGSTTVQYAYDGDGKRASKTVNGTATSYAYDVNAALPVVLTETTSGVATTYLYGADLFARYDNAGTPTYYHADGLGSVRALSNSAGQSVAAYNYDAFGAVRNSSGAASTFKFAGEQSDDEVGLIYLRARYYDASTGRLLQRDTIDGSVLYTKSWNMFVYVYNNPVRMVDPYGLWGISTRVNVGYAGGIMGGSEGSAGIGPEFEFPSWNPLDWRIGVGAGGELKATGGAQAEGSGLLGASIYAWDRRQPIPGASDAPITSCAGVGGSASIGGGAGISGGGCTGQGKTGVKLSGSLRAGVGGGVHGYISVGTGASWTFSPREAWNSIVGFYNSVFGGGNYYGVNYYSGGGYGGGGGGADGWGGPPSGGK